MFNDYVWKTYLNGMGKEVVDFFEKNLSNIFTKEYADKICVFYKTYCPSNTIKVHISLAVQRMMLFCQKMKMQLHLGNAIRILWQVM